VRGRGRLSFGRGVSGGEKATKEKRYEENNVLGEWLRNIVETVGRTILQTRKKGRKYGRKDITREKA